MPDNDNLISTLSGHVTGALSRGRDVVDSTLESARGAIEPVIRESAENLGSRSVGERAREVLGIEPEYDAAAEARRRKEGRNDTSEGAGGDSGAAAVLAQSDTTTSSVETPPETDASRGTPHPDRNALRQAWRQAGYHRIQAFSSMFGKDALVLGHLLFRVPPLAIRINKGNITYRWKPLRTNESIAVKSGNGECYIELDLAFVGLQQINDTLAPLITLWKKMPFCFVENSFIRSQMIPDQPEDSMMLCLESLVLDAVAGSPNVVWATLITSWFNYKPFSQNAYYRRHWRGVNDNSPDVSAEDPTARLEAEVQARVLSQLPNDDAETSIIDLSALQEPEALTIAMPPETRLQVPSRTSDPSDPFIKPTYPVVYPWNSVPFMQRIVSAPDNPKQVVTWTDGLRMKWNSFIRTQMPRHLAYTHEQESIPVVRNSEGRSRTADSSPEPVSGDRNIILFIGDSITVGYLDLHLRYSDTGAGQARNPEGQFIPVPLHNFRPPAAFRTNQTGEGFEFYSIARVGASATGGGGLARRFRDLIGSNEFKTPGGRDGSKLAAVVFMAGINDGPKPDGTSVGVTTSDVMAAYNEVKGLAVGAEAIFCPMTPWPIAGIADRYVNAQNELALIALCERIMSTWGNSSGQWKVINLHEHLSQNPSGFDGAPRTSLGYAVNPQDTSGLDPHLGATTRSAGQLEFAQYVARQIPWSSLRANIGAATTWTVCHIEDGDTIWAFREGEIRQIRFKYMNTFETYYNYNRAEDTAIYGQREPASLGTGQDAGRPADQQFGRLAKEEVIRFLGAAADGSGNGATCEIEFDEDRDAYGRYLGVISKGGTNLNLLLVQRGLAVVPEEYRDAAEGTQYVQAWNTAREANLGYHNWQAISSIPGTRVMMEPDEWLSQHPPATGNGGEFGFSQSSPPPGCQGSTD